MKLYKLLLIPIFLFVSINLMAQNNPSCKAFAKSGIAILDSTSYVHDGRYNAVKLSEGDNIDVYKPFYRGRKYKIIVIAEENLPGIVLKINNIRREQLFLSKQIKNTQTWIFTPERNENLIISVEVNKKGETNNQANRGCVAVLIGYDVG